MFPIFYMNTVVYQIIKIVLCLIVFSFIGCIVYERVNVTRQKKKSKKGSKKGKYKGSIWKNKKIEQWFGVAALWAFVFVGYVHIQESQYEMKESFVWDLKEKKSDAKTELEVFERKVVAEKSQYEEMLHMEWYEENGDGKIDRQLVESYVLNVEKIFLIVPDKDDVKSEMDEQDPIFLSKKKNYEMMVGSDHSKVTEEKLWEGAQDGIEVCKVYHTSENYFQTAVLAESACEKAYKAQKNYQDYLPYSAIGVFYFEGFLDFIVRDAGGGYEVEEHDPCFRTGKMVYRLSKESAEEDEKLSQHCGLFAYGCAQYYMENISIEDNDYIVYLYNSGITCLNIIKWIEDDELIKELCEKELKRWEILDKIDVNKYNKEGKDMEEIKDVESKLEAYCG